MKKSYHRPGHRRLAGAPDRGLAPGDGWQHARRAAVEEQWLVVGQGEASVGPGLEVLRAAAGYFGAGSGVAPEGWVDAQR
jgi:hypothetical protein